MKIYFKWIDSYFSGVTTLHSSNTTIKLLFFIIYHYTPQQFLKLNFGTFKGAIRHVLVLICYICSTFGKELVADSDFLKV